MIAEVDSQFSKNNPGLAHVQHVLGCFWGDLFNLLSQKRFAKCAVLVSTNMHDSILAAITKHKQLPILLTLKHVMLHHSSSHVGLSRSVTFTSCSHANNLCMWRTCVNGQSLTIVQCEGMCNNEEK